MGETESMSPIPPKAREEERGAAMVGALELGRRLTVVLRQLLASLGLADGLTRALGCVVMG